MQGPIGDSPTPEQLQAVRDEYQAEMQRAYAKGDMPWQQAVDAATFDEITKLTPPRKPSKIERQLVRMRDFLRRLSGKQLEEAQRVYRAFMQPKFSWARPQPLDKLAAQRERREFSRYPNPVPPGKQHNAMARRRRQMYGNYGDLHV